MEGTNKNTIMKGKNTKLIGENLRRCRKRADMTLTELSNALLELGHDVNFNTLSSWERGENRMYADRIPDIARLLNCHPADFFTVAPNEENDEAAFLTEKIMNMPHDLREIIIHAILKWKGDLKIIIELVGMYMSLDGTSRHDIAWHIVHLYQMAQANGKLRPDSPTVDVDYVDRKCMEKFK